MVYGFEQPLYEEDDVAYNSALVDWSDNMSEDYFESVKFFLNTDLTTELKMNIAYALASDYINIGESKIFDIYRLTSAHAYCFMNNGSGIYQKEVEKAFDESLR
jgi:hypothetical protein